MRNSSVIIALVLLTITTLCNTSRYLCDKNAVPCGCGQAPVDINARIVNGEDAIPSSWAMIVSLKDGYGYGIHSCGGTILSESYILTAAHCVDNLPSDVSSLNFTIAAGIHNLSQADQIIRQVDKIIIHPLWDRSTLDKQYDIAILHLAKPLDLETNSSLTRTCLPPRSNTSEEVMQYPSNGTNVIAIGWGDTSYGGDAPDILQQVTITSIHSRHKICASTMYNPLTQFCAGLYEGGKSKKNIFHSQ
jgi:secreted trypsin-like serine protease